MTDVPGDLGFSSAAPLEGGGVQWRSGEQVQGTPFSAQEHEAYGLAQAMRSLEEATTPVQSVEKESEEWRAKVEAFNRLSDEVLSGKDKLLREQIARNRQDVGQLLVQWAEMTAHAKELSFAYDILGVIHPLVITGAFRGAAAGTIVAELPIAFGDTSEEALWRSEIAGQLYFATHLMNLAVTLGVGTTLLARGLMLKENRRLLKDLEETQKRRPDLHKPLSVLIQALSAGISSEEKALRQSVRDYAAAGLIASAGALRAMITVFHVLSGPLGAALDSVGAVALVVGELTSIRRLERAKQEQKGYSANLRPSGPSWEELQRLKATREKAKAARQAKFGNDLNEFLREVKTLEEAEIGLKAKGIHLANLPGGAPNSLEELKSRLQEAATQEALLRQSDTRSVMTRKALWTLIEKKHENILGRHRSVLRGEKFKLSAAMVILSISLVLKVLVIAGVVMLPTVVLLLPGVVFLGLAFTLAVAGLFFYFRHRPNLFKSMLKGHTIKKAWAQLRLSVAEVRHHRMDVKRRQADAMIEAMSATEVELTALVAKSPQDAGLQARLEATRARLHEKRKEILAKHADLTHRLTRLDETQREHRLRVLKLQRKIEQAAWKDFMGRVTPSLSEQTAHADTIMEELLKGLAQDPPQLDEETQELLKQEMGIDLERLRETLEGAEFEKELAAQLKAFFALDRAGLLALGRWQTKAA